MVLDVHLTAERGFSDRPVRQAEHRHLIGRDRVHVLVAVDESEAMACSAAGNQGIHSGRRQAQPWRIFMAAKTAASSTATNAHSERV